VSLQFCARKSDPFSQRAHLALVHAGIAVDEVWGGALSLQTSEELLTNSLEIMDWALDQMESPDWTDWDLDQMDDGITLIELADGPFWGYLQEALAHESHDLRQELIVLSSGFLAQLETLLSDQPYLLGEKALLADFAILPLVHYFTEHASQEWDTFDLPHVKRWYSQLFSLPESREIFSCR
jgi:glutathione S-transferase